MILWVVSGACRHVGKTWLATRLAALLPNAVYVKIGHGRPRPDGPENYFTCLEEFAGFQAELVNCDHLVIESNALALEKKGDVRCFISAKAHSHNIRDDAAQLESAAHIVIKPDADEKAWYQTLVAILPPSKTEAICRLLRAQRDCEIPENGTVHSGAG